MTLDEKEEVDGEIELERNKKKEEEGGGGEDIRDRIT